MFLKLVQNVGEKFLQILHPRHRCANSLNSLNNCCKGQAINCVLSGTTMPYTFFFKLVM